MKNKANWNTRKIFLLAVRRFRLIFVSFSTKPERKQTKKKSLSLTTADFAYEWKALRHFQSMCFQSMRTNALIKKYWMVFLRFSHEEDSRRVNFIAKYVEVWKYDCDKKIQHFWKYVNFLRYLHVFLVTGLVSKVKLKFCLEILNYLQ